MLEENRFMVIGHADTIPFAPDNSTSEYRALNRRVEIVIRQAIEGELEAAAEELGRVDTENLEVDNSEAF